MMLKSVMVLVLLASACGSSPSSTVDDFPDGGLAADATAENDSNGSQTPADGGMESPDANETCWETSPTELLTDPDNCGICGHSCLGGPCSNGVCDSLLVTSTASLDDEIVSFAAGGLYIAWTIKTPAGWEVWASYTDATNPHRVFGPAGAEPIPDYLQIVGDFVYFPSPQVAQGSLREIKLDGTGGGDNSIFNDDPVTGAATVIGTEMYWATSQGSFKRTTVGSGTASLAYLNAGIAEKMINDGTNIFYWTGTDLIKGPVTALDPVSPALTTLAPDIPGLSDFAVSPTAIIWYDDTTEMLYSSLKSGGTSPTGILSTGGIAIDDSAGYSGLDNLVNAYNISGTKVTTIAALRYTNTVAGGSPCVVMAVPRRIEVAGNYVYIAAREETTCSEAPPLTMGWRLYKAPRL